MHPNVLSPAPRPSPFRVISGWVAIGAALGLAPLLAYKLVHRPPRVVAPVETAHAKEVDLESLSRAPSFVAGRDRYAVLGLGQDPATGGQVVWLRSYGANRIGAFAPGDKLFDGRLKVSQIKGDAVVLKDGQKPIVVPIQP